MSGGRSVVRVPVRVEDQVSVGVVADPGQDVRVRDHEIGHPRVLGRRERARAAVGVAPPVPARPTAAAPPVAVVAVLIGSDRLRVRLPVLAPEPVGAGGDVVLGAVGVQAGDDVDLALVDEPRDRRRASTRRTGAGARGRPRRSCARVRDAGRRRTRPARTGCRWRRSRCARRSGPGPRGRHRARRSARSPGALPRPPACRRPSPRSCGSSSPPAGSRRVSCRGRRGSHAGQAPVPAARSRTARRDRPSTPRRCRTPHVLAGNAAPACTRRGRQSA